MRQVTHSCMAPLGMRNLCRPSCYRIESIAQTKSENRSFEKVGFLARTYSRASPDGSMSTDRGVREISFQ